MDADVPLYLYRPCPPFSFARQFWFFHFPHLPANCSLACVRQVPNPVGFFLVLVVSWPNLYRIFGGGPFTCKLSRPQTCYGISVTRLREI